MKSVQAQKRRKRQPINKRPDLGEGGERVNVLFAMRYTFPTCHLERSPLKALLWSNTAPHHNNKEKSKDKNGLKKNRREYCSKWN